MKSILAIALIFSAVQAKADFSFKCWNTNISAEGNNEGATLLVKRTGETIKLEKSFAFKDAQFKKIVQSYGGFSKQPMLNVIMDKEQWEASAAVLVIEEPEYMICTGETH